jgi:hypothetical protein
VLAGAAFAVASVGAVLAYIDLASPLRAPLTLFFLLVAPAAAVALALRGVEPLGRAVASLSAGIAVDLLVAQAMLALHIWSARGGVVAVAGISLFFLLLTWVRQRYGGRTARTRTL